LIPLIAKEGIKGVVDILLILFIGIFCFSVIFKGINQKGLWEFDGRG